MSNSKHLGILRTGIDKWNKWRMGPQYRGEFGYFLMDDVKNPEYKNPDLSDWDGAFLREVQFDKFIHNDFPHPGEMTELVSDFQNKKLELSFEEQKRAWLTLDGANLSHTNLSGADLNNISLCNANLDSANLTGANLRFADLTGASLINADLTKAKLNSAKLSKANLTRTILTNAELPNTNLEKAIMVETILEGTILTDSYIYGLSAWNLDLENTTQSNLTITSANESVITVDNLEVAQFIHLLLNNKRLRDVIDTITSKVILILGNFSERQKLILDSIRDEIRRHHDFTPILFDFDKPANKDLTGTVETLARMALFIIVDLTNPRSVPFELGTLTPFLSTTPILPIKMIGSKEFTMFDDLRKRYPAWVLETYEYENADSLILNLPELITLAKNRARQLRLR